MIVSEYTIRRAARQARADAVASRLDRLGQWRLGLAIVAAILALGVARFFDVASAMLAMIPFGMAILGLFILGKALIPEQQWVQRAIAYYQQGLDRLAGKWVGTGPSGLEFADPAHLYAADLDLFGRGSLFDRLCAARTLEGEQRLAGWLLTPASTEEIVARQQAIRDLRDRLDLREALAVAAGGAVKSVDYARLIAWGQQPAEPLRGWRRQAIPALGVFNLLAMLGWLGGELPVWLVLIGVAASVAVARPLLAWSRSVLQGVEGAAAGLSLLESLLQTLEREPFTASRLCEHQTAWLGSGSPASVQIRRLRSLVDWYASRRNPLFLPIALLMLWDLRLAIPLADWRSTWGKQLRPWLAAIADLEALSSLAGYAAENPADPFPTILAEDSGPPGIDAEGLGHPLIPPDQCVRNAVTLGGETGPALLLISGSNMSGKSTLLRALGMNIVLALAGGPVRATRMTLSPLRLGATIRIQDSLGEGRSRFFAEIMRVRGVLDQAKSPGPTVLFLFDELFAGTNSADRQAGARRVLTALLEYGAIGLVTTHDLALTEAIDQFPRPAVNMHFSDCFQDGELVFDHQMRPGVVPHGNGLALMRAVGLMSDEEPEITSIRATTHC